MESSRTMFNLGILGAALLVVSFLIYVFVPNIFFIVTFFIGLLLLIVGYVQLTRGINKASKRLEDLYSAREAEGYIISLDGPYIASNDEASIVTLEIAR